MRLSDIKGDRVFDVIADIIDPIACIAEDENAKRLLRREKVPKGMTAKGFLISRVREALPPLLKEHKADIICILSSIEGVSPKEYSEALDLQKLMKDVIELISDSAFTELFISAQTGEPSGSAPENTEAVET